MNRSKETPTQRSITAGADFLQLAAADAPPGGLADWLAHRLREAVADGRLPAGSRLPATRVLAEELRISRGVVTEAYRRLTEEGRLAGRGRGGTVVLDTPAPPAPPPSVPSVPSASEPALFEAAPVPASFDALRAAPARIDLSPGVPDLAAFPRAAWLRAERAVLDGLAAHEFGYGDPRAPPRCARPSPGGWPATGASAPTRTRC